jgi:hypothetical protein
MVINSATGCEWDTTPTQVFGAIAQGKLRVDQLQIELHLPTVALPEGMQASMPKPTKEQQWEILNTFFNAAVDAGMRLFHKERNPYGDGYKVCMRL